MLTAPKDESRLTRRQWHTLYAAIAGGLVLVAAVLAIINPADVLVVEILMGTGLALPVCSLLGRLTNRPHVWLHISMLFFMMFWSAILAGVVNGINS